MWQRRGSAPFGSTGSSFLSAGQSPDLEFPGEKRKKEEKKYYKSISGGTAASGLSHHLFLPCSGSVLSFFAVSPGQDSGLS